jgi:AcrR family transcriptional regulator
VSKGVVTYHFPSKDELLRHVVLDLYMRGGERLAGVENADTPLDALDAYVTENLAFVVENPTHVRAAMEVVANLRGPAGERSFPAPGHDPVTAHLQGLIEDGQRAGLLAAVDAHAVAMVVRAAIDTAAAAAATDPDFPHEAFARTLRRVVRATLEPVP